MDLEPMRLKIQIANGGCRMQSVCNTFLGAVKKGEGIVIFS